MVVSCNLAGHPDRLLLILNVTLLSLQQFCKKLVTLQWLLSSNESGFVLF